MVADEKIVKATSSDAEILADMLFDMYQEVSPTTSSQDKSKYIELAKYHIGNDDVYFDDLKRGFFIMRDESVPVIDIKLWNGVSVYIKPPFRKSRLLRSFYSYMFSHYDGTIMGFTEYNSEHNKVLSKRHKLLGYVYELNR